MLFKLVGPCYPPPLVNDCLAAFNLADCVVAQPSVPNLESLNLMAEADVLISMDAPVTDPNVFLPSKLVDYLGAARPLLGRGKMKLSFLEGADEVGASCTLVEMEGRRILVDSGIRMGAAPGLQLPNFSVLDELGPPEEVLMTHAHPDHTGTLPVLVPGLPVDVPVRCTPPTRAITRVLLADAVKIMEQ